MHQFSRKTFFSTAYKTICFFIVAVLALSPLLQVTHLLQVRHQHCLEHGDLIDTPQTHEQTFTRFQSELENIFVAAQKKAHADNLHQHFHCVALESFRHHVNVLLSSDIAAPHLFPIFYANPFTVLHVQFDKKHFLMNAPKHSPPVFLTLI